MPNDWTPIFCVSAFLVIALTLIIVMVIWERRTRIEQEFTSEQTDALRRQGNMVGGAFFVMVILGLLLNFIAWVFPGIKDQIPVIMQPILTILGLGVGFYLGISAIKHEVSILRGRGQRKYPQGQAAVTTGIGILAIIGVILYIIWLKLTGN